MKTTTPALIKSVIIILPVLFSLFLFSCSKNDEPEPTPEPGLSNVTTVGGTLSGKKNTVITINGSNFITDLSKIKVLVNDNDCQVLSATSATITAKIPPACGTGKIVLIIDGKRMEGPEFTFVNSYTISSYTNGIAGVENGHVATAKLDEIESVAIDKQNNKFIGQYIHSKIWKIDNNDIATVFAGNGTAGIADGNGSAAQFTYPEYSSVGPDGNLYVADDNRIRKIDPQGNVSTIYNSGSIGLYGIKAMPGGIYSGSGGNFIKISYNGQLLWHLKSKGSGSTIIDGDTSIASFNMYGNIEIDSTEQNIYFGNNLLGSNNASQIRKFSLLDKTITTIAGTTTVGSQDGPAQNASFKLISDLRFDKSGGLWIADTYNNKIRLLKDGNVTTVIGISGPGDVDGDAATAKIKSPTGIAFDSNGVLFIACYDLIKLKKMVID